MHGLHPYDVPTRVEQALDGVRPYLGSHGGDVELLEVTDEGAVRLRLLGSCDGCPSSSVTLELAVQDAIEAAAPEVTSIEVETPSHGRRRRDPDPGRRAALPARLGTGAGRRRGTRCRPSPTSRPGRPTRTTAGGTALFVCRVGQDLFAFRDVCARCAGSLAGAVPERRLGGCRRGRGAHAARPAARTTTYDGPGACLDVPDLHLDPFPLLVEGGTVSVAVPAAVGA